MAMISYVHDRPAESTRRRRLARARQHALAAVAGASLLSACSGTAPAPPEPQMPTVTSTHEIAPSAAGIAAYGEFWRVSELAFAAPTAQDWEAELSMVARGQALTDVVIEVRNYASVPAHVEGAITHDARPDPALAPQPDRVAVLDCIDISGSTLVADADGAVLDDQASQTPRYQYRAEVVRDASGTWLVETTAPSLDQPC
ncbi:hypothetical protein GCM10017691_40970 [Pseudonocardia petroleophila]|uniref:Uncharacterized protein n=1 Tax=Pseudonocardia petroleophila TaxID=37331 RepID=A0A7G7MBP1_9PSEU|nr:hypothetical protein [Pseudonocardia petroleophila]QNG50202.1 hypothetical protein H6H00_18280 [Pseudonocardia petroleophila]